MWPLNVAAFVMSEDNIIVKASGPQVNGGSADAEALGNDPPAECYDQ